MLLSDSSQGWCAGCLSDEQVCFIVQPVQTFQFMDIEGKFRLKLRESEASPFKENYSMNNCMNDSQISRNEQNVTQIIET